MTLSAGPRTSRPHLERPRQRGLTLIELMVSTAILAIVMVAATGALLAQNKSYVRTQGSREAREQGAVALDALERAIRMAGYGIDPQLAFDFDYYDCRLGSAGSSFTGATQCSALKRDSAAQSDELVVNFRDPRYNVNATGGCAGSPTLLGNVWRVTAASASGPSVSLEMRDGDDIRRGQVLQIICQDVSTYTYVTVASAPTPSACGGTKISLEGTITTALGGPSSIPWSRPDLLAQTCFGAGTARAFKVSRQRFFIQRVLAGANGAFSRPYLMLDQGLDLAGAGSAIPDGSLDDNDLLPVASDIEDLQIAYVLDQIGIKQAGAAVTTGTYFRDNDSNGIWGDTDGVTEQLTANTASSTYGLDAAVAAARSAIGSAAMGAPCYNSSLAPFREPCLFDKASLESSGSAAHAYRWLPWTGNVVGVRLSVVSRSISPTHAATEASKASPDVRTLPRLENRSLIPLDTAPGVYGSDAIGFQHNTFSGLVRPINLASSGLFNF